MVNKNQHTTPLYIKTYINQDIFINHCKMYMFLLVTSFYLKSREYFWIWVWMSLNLYKLSKILLMIIFNIIFFPVKIPQIVKVVQASSVQGLSLLSFLLELVALTTTVAYSLTKAFPFRWFEVPFIFSESFCRGKTFLGGPCIVQTDKSACLTHAVTWNG